MGQLSVRYELECAQHLPNTLHQLPNTNLDRVRPVSSVFQEFSIRLHRGRSHALASTAELLEPPNLQRTRETVMNVQLRTPSFLAVALLSAAALSAQQVKLTMIGARTSATTKRTRGEKFTHKTRYGWIESKPQSTRHWRQKVGRKWNRVEMFPSWRWE